MARQKATPICDRGRRLVGLYERPTKSGVTFEFIEYVGKGKVLTNLTVEYGVTNRTAAIDWYRKHRELEDARGKRSTSNAMRLSEVAARYLADTRAYVERCEQYGVEESRKRVISEWSTYDERERHIGTILRFFKRDPFVHTIGPQEVSDLLNWVREQPGRGIDPKTGRRRKASEAVVNHVKSAMSALCKEAMAAGAHYSNPTRDILDRVKPIPGPRADYVKRIVRPEDLRRLPDFTTSAMEELIVALLVISGLRVSELLALRWECWQGNVLLIPTAMGRKKGERPFLKRGTKTGAIKEVPLDSRVHRLLMLWRDSEREAGYGNGGDFILRSPDEFLIHSKEKAGIVPGQPISKAVVLRAVRNAAKAAGLDPELTTRDIRSSVSTALEESGLSEQRKNLIMGNTAEVRKRHYNGLYRDERETQETVAELERVGLHVVAGGDA